MTDEDAEERQQLAAALAAFKALQKGGFPLQLATELAAIRLPLAMVVLARPPRRRGIRRVLQWMWSFLDVVTIDLNNAADRVRDSMALQNDHHKLFEGSHALEAAMAALPAFASTGSACAAKLQPRRSDEGKLLGAGVAAYLACVATDLLSKKA